MADNHNADHQQHGGGGNYWRFMAMVATSTAIMFGLMYLNTYELDHVFWSETRFWMTFVMGGMMMIVMLLFMRSEGHTSELQSLMRISYAVFCLNKKNNKHTQ